MFAAIAVLMVLASPVGEVVETTRNLELKLDVIEAFEHGPVILDVTLTNRGKKSLSIMYGPSESRIDPPVAWKAWWPPRLCFGSGVTIQSTFKPGESRTERHHLHLDYVSHFPAGTHQVEVSWRLTWYPDAEATLWSVLVTPTKTFPVTISPATPANRWALAARLEAEFAALPADAEGSYRNQLYELGEKLRETPHKELIPLALRMLDRTPVGDTLNWSVFFRSRMASVVFRADPGAAHRIFVDRLLASPRRADPRDVFDIWEAPEPTFAGIAYSLFGRYTCLDHYLDPESWGYLSPEYEINTFLHWANVLAPCVLPDSELKRLSAAKDFAVRAWTYSYFGRRLGREWCGAFLEDARRVVGRPDPKKLVREDPALRYLIWNLTCYPDDLHGRKLFDAFLTGAEDHWITKAAREELAEREKKEKKRKQ